MSKQAVLVLNPLGLTLHHYETELKDTLRRAGYRGIEPIPTVAGDGIVGMINRIRIATASVAERIRLGREYRDRTVLVVWPLFGYFDPWTMWKLCKNNRVMLVIHDPTPLRQSYGYSRLARRAFKWAVDITGIDVIYHTELAQLTGVQQSGVRGSVVPHPIAANEIRPSDLTAHVDTPVIRVMGQYKSTRSMAPMEAIALHRKPGLRLEIYGRGWPSVEGWEVYDRFVPEQKFTKLLYSSDCIVIPYDSFFQSGVAVRCIELGVRVVAPRHEHIEYLFGSDWPGMVRNEHDWHNAVLRALAVDRRQVIERAEHVRTRVTAAWAESLGNTHTTQDGSRG